jgi:hypothetical protein
MSDFWKKFKGVFVVEDPNSGATTKPTNIPASAPKPAANAQNQSPIPPSVSKPILATSNGAVSEKFMQVLAGSLESANQEGFDYFEFKQAIANLKNVPMDDATRYKSAFAMAQSMGATTDKLLSSAQHYLNVLKSEETKFLQAAENQRVAQVGNKQAQIENLEVAMKQKAEQIKKLTDEIGAHQKEITAIKDDIAQSTVKVQQTVNDFETTYMLLANQIQHDLSQMQIYLK